MILMFIFRKDSLILLSVNADPDQKNIIIYFQSELEIALFLNSKYIFLIKNIATMLEYD